MVETFGLSSANVSGTSQEHFTIVSSQLKFTNELGLSREAFGEVFFLDGVLAAEDEKMLDNVAKLADVAGPGVIEQQLHDVGRQRFDGLLFGGQFFNEMVDQQG